MAELAETKELIIRPGEKIDVRTGFGVDLDNGNYAVSNLGPALVYMATAISEATLPSAGHPLVPKHPIPGAAGLDDVSTVFLWVDASVQTAKFVISAAI